MWCVYVTWEPATGRYYVGKTSLSNLRAGYQGSGYWPKAALAKGRTLVTEVLSTWTEEADAYEAELVVVCACRDFDPMCKNVAPGGLGNLAGSKLPPETRAKIGAAGLGREVTAETRRKIGFGNAGRVRSASTLAKLSLVSTARWADPVVRAKLVAARKAAASRPEVYAKASAASKANWTDDAYRAKNLKHLAVLNKDPVRLAALRERMEQLNAARKASRG